MVDQRKLDLAMQVLKELQKDGEPEDPYMKMSKKLDGGKAGKKEKRNFALRHATEEQEEEKKGGQSSEQEVSSGSERERA